MSWSTPRTFVNGEVIQAADLRTYVSDDLQWLYDNRWDAALFDLNLLTATCGSDLTLQTYDQDIPDMTVTLDRIGYWLILGLFDTDVTATANMDGTIRLKVGGVESGINLYGLWPDGVRITQSGLWVYDAASQPLIAKFTAWAYASSGTIRAGGTRMAAWCIQAP